MRITGKREVQNRLEAGGGSVLSTFHLKPSTKRSAFTLIEMIGVMALMAILAAVVVPPLFRTLDDAKQIDEDANLDMIADALLKGIKAYRTFPNPNAFPNSSNGWVTLAQNFYPKGTNALRYVFPKATNFAKTERRVYLDPEFLTYLNGNYSMPSGGYSGTLPNGALRMYILSSSKSDLELSCGPNQPGQFMNPAPQDPSSGYNPGLISDILNWTKAFEGPGSANFGSLLVPQSIAKWGTASGTQYKRGEYLHVKIVGLLETLSVITLTDYGAPVVATSAGAGGDDAVNGFTSTYGYEIDSSGTPDIIVEPKRAPFDRFSSGAADKNRHEVRFDDDATSGGPFNIRFTLAASPRYSLNSGTTITQVSNYSPVGSPNRRNTVSFTVPIGSPIFLYDGLGSLQWNFIPSKQRHRLFYRGTWQEVED